MPISGTPDSAASPTGSHRDPYRGVVIVLLALALLGTVCAIIGGIDLGNRVLLAAAVTLGLSAAVLIGVAAAQAVRAGRTKNEGGASSSADNENAEPPARTGLSPNGEGSAASSDSTSATGSPRRGFPDLKERMVRAGVLLGIAAQTTHTSLPVSADGAPSSVAREEQETPAPKKLWPVEEGLTVASSPTPVPATSSFNQWFSDLGGLGVVAVAMAAVGGSAVLLLIDVPTMQPTLLSAAIAAALCLGAAGLAATAARYLAEIDPVRLPEAPGLCRGARMVGWVLLLATLSMFFAWAGQQTILRILFFLIVAVDGALCYGLLLVKRPEGEAADTFPLDLNVLTLLGSRTNVLASILDGAERQLGIDLRSTWALTVVRRSLEPLVIGLCLVGWLSTSLTVVGTQEQGLVERLGVPLAGPPLLPGLHLHWPWPVDQVYRIPVQRVQALNIGHEGEEEGGPENVLWARQHAANEYTLLLGDGRDLVTIDAAVQFQIADARAWRYHTQNPADALRSIAYRAVMRTTVNRTLSDVLSQNLVAVTGRMRAMVQQDADALGLGVQVLGFTVGGMHPPVPVASDYEAVVSAELGKVTAVVNAQVYHNLTVPAAEADVLVNGNTARAEGAELLARAAGEAWSFRRLELQYNAAPQEYLFRRRLETLEKGLAGRRFTVVDSRFQRDGGELWVIP